MKALLALPIVLLSGCGVSSVSTNTAQSMQQSYNAPPTPQSPRACAAPGCAALFSGKCRWYLGCQRHCQWSRGE